VVAALLLSIGLVVAGLRLTAKFGATVVSAPISVQFIGVDNKDNIPIPDGGETTFWIKFTNNTTKTQSLALYSTVYDVSGGKVWSGLYDNATGSELPDSEYGTNYKKLVMAPSGESVVKIVLADVSANPGDSWIWNGGTGFSIFIDNISA